MKNITISVSNTVHRNARVWAARHDTSVSAVVAFLLENLDVVVTTRTRYDESAVKSCSAPITTTEL